MLAPEDTSGNHKRHAALLSMGAGYFICSSMMLVFNKWALRVFPFPSSLMALQFAFSALSVKILGWCGQLEVDGLKWDLVKAFWVVPLVFEIAIFTNIKVLAVANVETCIVFRTTVPVITSIADYLFLGRQWLSPRSTASLSLILLGAVGYAQSSKGLHITTYYWGLAYVLVLAFEMVYVKHILNRFSMSTWTRVYYNNIIALMMCPPFLLVGSEYKTVTNAVLMLLDGEIPPGMASPVAVIVAVSCSCVAGVAISFFGFGFRTLVTATTFTVVGVLNKIVSAFASIALWQGEPSALSLGSLLLCIVAGTMYQQAPAAVTKATKSPKSQTGI